MIFNRYRGKDWNLALQYSRPRLMCFLDSKTDACAAFEAQLLLKCYYRGPWRMIAAVLRRELGSAISHYCWYRWEWVRVKIFRLPQDEALATQDRIKEEEDAIEELARELR